jgi:hypothetical protein
MKDVPLYQRNLRFTNGNYGKLGTGLHEDYGLLGCNVVKSGRQRNVLHTATLKIERAEPLKW